MVLRKNLGTPRPIASLCRKAHFVQEATLAQNPGRADLPEPNLPKLKCRRCHALVELTTVISRFADQPESQVFVCDVCGFIDMVPVS